MSYIRLPGSEREWDHYGDRDRGERVPAHEEGWSSVRCACGARKLVLQSQCTACEKADA